MKTITIQMKVSAPNDVNPGQFFEWLTAEIERWHPANPLTVINGAALEVARRGPKETLTEGVRAVILQKHADGMPKARIAEHLCIARGIVQRAIRQSEAEKYTQILKDQK